MTQEQLAERAGISRNQLQNIESGWSDRAKRTPANPRLNTIVALCAALGVAFRADCSHPNRVLIELEKNQSKT